jgi:oligopeptide transport system permease protein
MITTTQTQVQADAFDRVPKDIAKSQAIVRPSLTYWEDAWRRLKKNKVAIVCMTFLAFMVLVAIVGPVLYPNYRANNLEKTYSAPDKVNWFGTDDLGRDQFARVLRGARVSLFIGVTCSLICVAIGTIYGGFAGYMGGWVDDLMMRIVDVLITIPDMIILILLLVVFKPSIGTLIFAMCLTGWTGMARQVRGQVLQIKESDFVLVSRIIGSGTFRIIIKHLIPNTIGIIIVRLMMLIPIFIFEEAFLSFIGLGVRLPEASWGNLAEAGALQFPNNLYMFFIPAIFMMFTMLAFNLFGDGLRDALDPKMRK